MGRAQDFVFDAETLTAALEKLADHRSEEPSELWRNGKFVCCLEAFVEGESPFWRLA